MTNSRKLALYRAICAMEDNLEEDFDIVDTINEDMPEELTADEVELEEALEASEELLDEIEAEDDFDGIEEISVTDDMVEDFEDEVEAEDELDESFEEEEEFVEGEEEEFVEEEEDEFDAEDVEDDAEISAEDEDEECIAEDIEDGLELVDELEAEEEENGEITSKCKARKLVAKLDRIASYCQKHGNKRLAYQIDVVSNTLERI